MGESEASQAAALAASDLPLPTFPPFFPDGANGGLSEGQIDEFLNVMQQDFVSSLMAMEVDDSAQDGVFEPPPGLPMPEFPPGFTAPTVSPVPDAAPETAVLDVVPETAVPDVVPETAVPNAAPEMAVPETVSKTVAPEASEAAVPMKLDKPDAREAVSQPECAAEPPEAKGRLSEQE